MLSRSQNIKIALILFLMAICIPLILYKGTLDPFVPYHISVIKETIYYGRLVENTQVPWFYTLGAQISLICGFSPEQLISYPIQLIPYAILFFAIIYKISGNFVLSALFALIELCSGTDGTEKIFFWVHGIGGILFLSILLLVFILLKQDRHPKPFIFLAAVLTSISMVYIDYDYTAMILILFAVILMMLILFYKVLLKYNTVNRVFDLPYRTFSNLFLIFFVVVFGLSNFVYSIFIPSLQATHPFSSLEKLLMAYFNTNLTAGPLSQIMVNYPAAISIVSGIKYALLAITILLFCIVILKTIYKEKSLNRTYLFIFAFILTTGFYAILRLMIGGDIISLIWLPGIFCVALFFRMPKKYRLWAFVLLAVILVSTPLYYGIMSNGGYIDRDEYQFNSYKTPVQWFVNYNNGNLTVSDELTKDFFILDNPNPSVGNLTEQYKIMPTEDALALVQLSNSSLSAKYYILNERLNRMDLQNWIIIESWGNSKEQIDTNNQVNKIYDVPLLFIYYHPS